MKQIIVLLITIISFSSCKSSKQPKRTTSTKIITKKSKDTNKKVTSSKTKIVKSETNYSSNSKSNNIIDYAKQFKGVRYKWGGTTKSGMDCSGLVYESFKAYDILLPRSSKDIAKKGSKITLKHVKKGDLLFFKTNKRKNTINHVGLIVAIRDNDIEFIHATTSRGVIISRLNETYWLNAFSEARRVL